MAGDLAAMCHPSQRQEVREVEGLEKAEEWPRQGQKEEVVP